MQAVMVLSLICATGLALGKVKIFGISLGVIFVFFAGIVAGHFGVQIDHKMLALAQNFGLILYIYALGLQVGPGFFSSFKKGGVKLNLLALLLLIAGSAMALGAHWMTGTSLSDTVGLLAGAVTNTPMLGAAQQTLLQMNPEGFLKQNMPHDELYMQLDAYEKLREDQVASEMSVKVEHIMQVAAEHENIADYIEALYLA